MSNNRRRTLLLLLLLTLTATWATIPPSQYDFPPDLREKLVDDFTKYAVITTQEMPCPAMLEDSTTPVACLHSEGSVGYLQAAMTTYLTEQEGFEPIGEWDVFVASTSRQYEVREGRIGIVIIPIYPGDFSIGSIAVIDYSK